MRLRYCVRGKLGLVVCAGALLQDPLGGRKCTVVSRKCTSSCVAPSPPQASPRANDFPCIRKHHAEPLQELNLTLESNTYTIHHTANLQDICQEKTTGTVQGELNVSAFSPSEGGRITIFNSA